MNKLYNIYKKNKTAGFTLIELIVIIAVMAIITGISVVSALGWIAHSKYKQNNEAARTIYYAMQSRLAVSASRGVQDDLKADINKYSTDISTERKDSFGLPTQKDNEGNVHLYSYIKVDKGDYNSNSKSDAVKFIFSLLRPYIFDESILDGSFVVEFDNTAGTVHSVFYSSSVSGFDYSTEGISTAITTYHINKENRSEDELEECGIGYYASNQINVAALSSTNLRITNLSLNNEETLNLRFSSNSTASDNDTKFTLKFYEKKDGEIGQVVDEDHFLFSTVITKDVFSTGCEYDTAGNQYALSNLTLKDKNNNEATVPFIVKYNGTAYELILDASMTSEKMAYLRRDMENGINDINGLSITRLNNVITGLDLDKPKDIFAVGEIGVNEAAIGNQEYTLGTPIKSSTENTMFAAAPSDEVEGTETYKLYEISKNRHLINVEFMEKNYGTSSDKRKYELITNLNWDSNVIYGIESSAKPEDHALALFPSIKKLAESATLDGSGFILQNFRLGFGSNVNLGDYPVANTSETDNKAVSLGIVAVNRGSIESLYFRKATLSARLSDKTNEDNKISRVATDTLKNIGIVSGVNYGNIHNLCFYSNCSVDADLDYSKTGATREDGAGIGMVAGVMKLGDKQKVSRLLIRGSVNGNIANVGDVSFTETSINGSDANSGYRFTGIGSVCGYAAFTDPDNKTMIGEPKISDDAAGTPIEAVSTTMRSGLNSLGKKSILNQASVKGNMFTGGIVGNLNTTATSTDSSHQIINVFNEGYISAEKNPHNGDSAKLAEFEKEGATFDTLEGFFTGGIVGYAYNSRISACTYTMKDAEKIADYSKESTAKNKLMEDAKGFFVGGICGFSDTSNVESCKTATGGYLVGYDYVGGITGGMKGEEVNNNHYVVISGNTINKAYVVGHSFVGGVAGSNREGSKIMNCNNDGAVAGYGIDIGGIVGKNVGTDDKEALISNCSSTLYDYGSQIFNLVKNVWQFFGSNVGGQVGFNEYGTVRYEITSTSEDETTVSSVSVGKNNVGGFIGYNSTEGNLRLGTDDDKPGYVSGRVYGTGDCIGGFIGLNTEAGILNKRITVSTNNIEGRYLIGGVIGANIIAPDSDTSMAIKYDNPISKISGTAAVGGIIGYNRLVKDIDKSILSPEDATQDDYYTNFISISDKNIINDSSDKLTTDKEYLFSIDGNISTGLVFNNAEVSAVTYGGGIMGFDAKDSKLVIKDAINRGKITEAGDNTEKIKVIDLVGDSVNEIYRTGLISGIIGFVNPNTVIDNCENKGAVDYKFSGYGAVAGLNLGLIKNCKMSSNMGKRTIDIIGGIVGINYDDGEDEQKDFNGISSDYTYKYYCGTITGCEKSQETTITGKNYVGGIAGLNIRSKDTSGNSYKGGIIKNCISYGEVSGENNAGGFVGINLGKLSLKAEDSSDSGKRLVVHSTQYAGGLVGRNTGKEETAVGSVESSGFGKYATVKVKATGNYAGGLVGHLEKGEIAGTNEDDTINYIINYATVDSDKYSGGIAGKIENDANIRYAENRGEVTSSKGYAGGIIPENNIKLKECVNRGNVTSSGSFAGGITAVNNSEIIQCEVSANGSKSISITSAKTVGGAVVADNPNGSVVAGCTVGNNDQDGKVYIEGNKLTTIGYIIGTNSGVIRNCKAKSKVDFKTNKNDITLGGIVGKNTEEGYINYKKNDSGNYVSHYKTLESSIDVTSSDKLKKVKYLGGIVGENYGHVANVKFDGNIGSSTYDATAGAGTAVGGIAGINAKESKATEGGLIEDAFISGAYIRIKGFFGANKSQSSKEKIAASAYVGGIVGLNKEGASVNNTYIDSNKISTIQLTNGMLGGIAGANEGIIKYSGYAEEMPMVDYAKETINSSNNDDLREFRNLFGKKITDIYIDSITDTEKKQKIQKVKNDIDNKFETRTNNCPDSDSPSNLDSTITPNNASKVTTIKMDGGKGYVAGITGLNAKTGSLTECASGKWMIFGDKLGGNAGDENSFVSGITAINESDKEFSYNINNAFVCRREINKKTLRYAGGVIALQSNSSTSDWKVSSCINLGVVKEYNAHDVSGIITNWINNGGNVENCYNFGTLFTNYQLPDSGTASGIVGLINGLTSGQTINIVSCQNHGIINLPVGSGLDLTKPLLNQTSNTYQCGNDIGGIVSKIYAPENSNELFKINIVDCVNGKDSTVIGFSKAVGIMCWVGSKDKDINSIIVNINRCRNYCDNIVSFNNKTGNRKIMRDRTAGIFGNKANGKNSRITEVAYNAGGGRISIRNCFNVCSSDPKDGDIWGKYVVNQSGDYGTRPFMFKDCSNNYYMDYSSFNYKNTNVLSIGESAKEENVQKSNVSGATSTIVPKDVVTPNSYDTVKNSLTRVYAVNDTSANDDVKYKAVTNGETYNLQKFSTDNAWISGEKIKANINDGTETKTTDIADIHFSFKDYDGSGKPSGGDITDDDVEGLYENLIDSDTLSPVTDVSISASEGKYKVTWNDPNASTEYYDIEAKLYKFDKGFAFDVENLDSYISNVVEGSGLNLQSFQKDIEFNFPNSITIDKDYDYYVVVRVRPQNSNIANNNIDIWSDYAYTSAQNIMTKPDLEVIRYQGKWYLHLKNADEFPTDTNWVVTAKTIDGKITNKQISKSNSNTKPLPYCVDFTLSNDCDSVLRATAKDDTTDTTYMESELFNASVFIPKNYIPSANGNIIIKNAAGTSENKADIKPTGKSYDDFEYTVNIQTNASFAYQPEFRVELYGTDNNEGSETYGKQVTIASQLVAINASNPTTVTFDSSNLPDIEEFENYSDIKFMITYASTGLGPVYNYFKVSDADAAKIKNGDSGFTRTNGYVYDKSTSEAYYSNPVNEAYKGSYTNNNRFEGQYTINFKDKPIISPEGVCSINEDDLMTYTYKWDESVLASNNYDVKIYGLTLENPTNPNSSISNEVEEDISEFYADVTKKIIKIATNDWSYDAIRLEVTNLGTGDNTGNNYLLGNKSTKNFLIPKRLPKLEAPNVSLVDQDGLKYKISWSGDIIDDYTVGFKAMLKDDEGLHEVGVVDDKNASHLVTDLEDYSGKDVEIFVVALADPDNNGGIYYDSPAGTSTDETILKRLDRPEVNFKWNDEFTTDDGYVSEEDFSSETSRLFAEVTGTSKLNGSYLLYGLLYENDADVKAAKEQLDSIIPDSGNITNETNKNIMTGVEDLVEASRLYAFGFKGRKIAEDEGSASSPYTYSLALEDFGNGEEEWSLKYAGRYVLPLIRSTGNTDISSSYSWSNYLKLPKVKFSTPNVTKDIATVEMKGNVFDLPRYNIAPRQEITSNMEFETYNWSRPDNYEDSYDVTLNLNNNTMSEDGSVNAWEVNAKLSITTVKVDTKEYLTCEIKRGDSEMNLEKIKEKIEEAILYDKTLDEDEDTTTPRRVKENETDGVMYYYTLNDDNTINTEEYFTYEEGDDGYASYGYNGDVYYVEKEITENDDTATCKLTIPGFTNYIVGTVLYDGANYIHYLFKKNLILNFEKDKDEYKYSLIMPRPAGNYNFNVDGEGGNTYDCSASYTSVYINEGSFVTHGNDDSEQFVSSDEVKVTNDKLE